MRDDIDRSSCLSITIQIVNEPHRRFTHARLLFLTPCLPAFLPTCVPVVEALFCSSMRFALMVDPMFASGLFFSARQLNRVVRDHPCLV